MGRNILSICDFCEVYIFHFRCKESDYMQHFQNDHADHEKQTRIVSDYVDEQPVNYRDVTDDYKETVMTHQLPDELREAIKIELYAAAHKYHIVYVAVNPPNGIRNGESSDMLGQFLKVNQERLEKLIISHTAKAVEAAEDRGKVHLASMIMSTETEALFDDGELFQKWKPIEATLINEIGYERWKAMQEAVTATDRALGRFDQLTGGHNE